MVTRSKSPPNKRVKLEPVSPNATPRISAGEDILADGDNCSICLQEITDQTVIPSCSHEFCFECLLIWTKQSRRCPLCAQTIGEYLIHTIRSRHDFSKHYLAPLRTSPAPQASIISATDLEHRPGLDRRRRLARARERERREREELNEADRLQRSIEKRRWLYRHGLYAKHVASNAFTRYRPYPSPTQFSASQDLISRTTSFVRRELQVWPNLDIEFLTTFTISIMKSIDIRSESAIKLLAEFLDMDAPYVEGGRHVNAEHFSHEIYSFVRSPYKDVFVYDKAVQYDVPSEVPPPPNFRSSRRWRRDSRSRSRSHSTSPSSFGSHSPNRSPSVPTHPSTYHAAHASSHTRSSSRSRTHVLRGSHEHTEVDLAFQPVQPEVMTLDNLSGLMLMPNKNGDHNGSADHVVSTEEVRPKSLEPPGKQSDPAPLEPNDVLMDNKREPLPLDDEEHVRAKCRSTSSSKGGRSELDAIMQHDIHAISPPSGSAQQRPTTARPPRNRSLRESVKAHLGNGKRKERPGAKNSANIHISNGKRCHGAANTARDGLNSISSLTDQSNLLSENNASTSASSDLPNGQRDMISLNVKGSQVENTLPRLPHVGLPGSHSTPDALHAKPRITSTREPLMLAMETAVRDRSPNQGGATWKGQADHVGTSRPPRNAINKSADCNPPLKSAHANHHSTESHDSDLAKRSRLLSRLKEEKDHACSRLSVDAVRCPTRDHHLSESVTGNDIVNPQVMEDQLRRQARLRVKIAAERRGISEIMSG